MVKLRSYADALDTALKAEKVQSQIDKEKNQRDKKRSFPNRQPDKGGGGKRKWKQPRKECPRCGRDHETKDCPQFTGSYYNCGEK